jgi:hypothetical protein
LCQLHQELLFLGSHSISSGIGDLAATAAHPD